MKVDSASGLSRLWTFLGCFFDEKDGAFSSGRLRGIVLVRRFSRPWADR